MKILFLTILLVFVSCNTNEVQRSDNKSINTATFRKETKESNKTIEEFSFEDFLNKFNKECTFQKKSVVFPLPVISLIDFEENLYDTTWLKLKDYECMEFTEPLSNIVEGKIILKINSNDAKSVITLGVEDTGIHIRYFFDCVSNKWRLVKVVDEST